MSRRGRSGVRKKGGAARRPNPSSPPKPTTTRAERPSVGVRAEERGAWRREVLAEVLRPTCWFDPGEEDGAPRSLTISFTGRRLDVKGKPRAGDRFLQEQTVGGVVPGTGPVAVTTEVRGINPGEWEVTAAPSARLGRSRPLPAFAAAEGPGHALWPRRVRPRAARTERLASQIRPLAPIPGVHPLSWGALVGLGVLLGLVVQALLLSREGEDIASALFVSAVAVVAGCAGAKAWYVVVQRGRRFDGWCVQGAILGGGVAAGIVLVSGSAIHAGAYLDATAPGLMLGMAVGRPGCFLAGCCYGRPTASRWGIWSSDRCVGIRRVPTQLIEAALCLATGVVALILALGTGLGGSGVLLAGSLAAFVLGRQMILPYRAQPRRTSFGHPATIALAAVTLIAAVVVGLS